MNNYGQSKMNLTNIRSDSKFTENVANFKDYLETQSNNLSGNSVVSIEAMSNLLRKFSKCLKCLFGNDCFLSKLNYQKIIKELTGQDMSLKTVYLDFYADIKHVEYDCAQQEHKILSEYLTPFKTEIYCKKDFDLSKKYSIVELKRASNANEIFLTKAWAHTDMKNKVSKNKVNTENNFKLGSISYNPDNLKSCIQIEYHASNAVKGNIKYDAKVQYPSGEKVYGSGNDKIDFDCGYPNHNFNNNLIITEFMNYVDIRNTRNLIPRLININPNAIQIITPELVKVLDEELTLRKNGDQKTLNQRNEYFKQKYYKHKNNEQER